MPPRTIAELPFRERPATEVLALESDAPDPTYAGYGWARVETLWLATEHGPPRRVDDALVIAVHAADDGEAAGDDVELEFEVEPGPGGAVTVLASRFLEAWLPRLPHDTGAIVLVMCNPHRATLRRPPAAGARPVHYGMGDVVAWLDPPDRIRLVAGAWRTLTAEDSMTTELDRRPGTVISDEEKQTYAGIWILKKLDLQPKDGGMVFPVVLPSELSPLDEILHELAVEDLLVMNTKKERWDLTKQGIAYLGALIDEATDLLDEFDDDDVEVREVVAELRRRKIDPYRARFLWGWYEGELDDLVLFQERRGVRPVEKLWAYYLTSDEFWNELAKDLE